MREDSFRMATATAYFLTNAALSGAMNENVETLFMGAGAKQFRSFGSTWIFQQIQESNAFECWCPAFMGSVISVRFWTSKPTVRRKPYFLR